MMTSLALKKADWFLEKKRMEEMLRVTCITVEHVETSDCTAPAAPEPHVRACATMRRKIKTKSACVGVRGGVNNLKNNAGN
jgi:aconitase B